MNAAPEASNTVSRPDPQVLRTTASTNDIPRISARRPSHNGGAVVRRNHSDGMVREPSAESANTATIRGGRREVLPSSHLPTVGNHSLHNLHGQQWHNMVQNHSDPHVWSQFLNEALGDNNQGNERARRQAIAMLIHQRQQQAQALGEIMRRRANSVTSPRETPVGLRRHAASVTGNTDSRPSIGPTRPYRSPASERTQPQQIDSHQAGDRGSDEYVLPRWQPDSEVNNCPICKHPFTFFFRKHHCRKCGRVVCANCSPHRITIPRQFIVHPPFEDCGFEGNADSSQEDDQGTTSHSHSARSALGGGQEVRLCNPCVPDPNPLPPSTYPQSPNRLTSFPRPESSSRREERAGRHGDRRHPIEWLRTSSNTQIIDLTSPTSIRQPNPLVYDRRSSQGPQPNPLLYGQQTPYGSAPNAPSTHFPSRRNMSRNHRQHASISVFPSSRYRSMLDVSNPASPHVEAPPPPPPPRQIAEEDECPICHEELPPKGSDGSEVEREAHVSSCIESHFSSSRPRTHSQPQPSTAIAAALASSSATPAQAGASSNTAMAGPSTRRRTAGMVVYHATEKDCIGEDGSTQECVICFEDLETGVEMGRLECLCKFHKACIRAWWDTKGVGACPVHQGGLT